MVADKGYDGGQNRVELESRGIEHYIAVGQSEAEKFKEKGLFAPSDFRLEEKHLICPVGKRSSRSIRDRGRSDTKFIFRKKDCKNCPLRDQCTRNQSTGRTVRISDYREVERRALEQAQTQAFKTVMARRQTIEHKQAEEVRFHGLRRARYRGLLRVTIQAILTAIVVNTKRMAALLRPLPRPSATC